MELTEFLAELKADTKFSEQLEKRKNVERPAKILKRTQYYNKQLKTVFDDTVYESANRLDTALRILDAVFHVDKLPYWQLNGFWIEGLLFTLAKKDVSIAELEKCFPILDAWKNKTVEYEYGSLSNEWKQVAKQLGIEA